MYGTPRFRAINRQYTTPIKSSPLVVPSAIVSASKSEEPRRAAPSYTMARSLPVRALKIMASVEKYTPAPDDSEPEQEDPDYETESSATRDTTTESEQRAAKEQAKADKDWARERRRTEPARGPSIPHRRFSIGLGQKEQEKTSKSHATQTRTYTNLEQRPNTPVLFTNIVRARRVNPHSRWSIYHEVRNFGVNGTHPDAPHKILPASQHRQLLRHPSTRHNKDT